MIVKINFKMWTDLEHYLQTFFCLDQVDSFVQVTSSLALVGWFLYLDGQTSLNLSVIP